MARIVCLANSRRPGGRCVAGIDLESGDWVRPLLKGRPAIPEAATRFGDHELQLLDVVEVELAAPTFATRFQCENRIITSKDWRIVGKLRPDDVMQYCSNDNLVLHSAGKVVEPSQLEVMPATKWRSLQLRRIDSVTFVPDLHKSGKWQARFHPGGVFSNTLQLSLTDPVAENAVSPANTEWHRCLVTVSLTEPIATHGKPELCYKLAAAILRLGP